MGALFCYVFFSPSPSQRVFLPLALLGINADVKSIAITVVHDHGWYTVPIPLLHPKLRTRRDVCPESCTCTVLLVAPVCLLLFPD